jgi:hypothetical protein
MASRGRGIYYYRRRGLERFRERIALEGKSVTGVLGEGKKTRTVRRIKRFDRLLVGNWTGDRKNYQENHCPEKAPSRRMIFGRETDEKDEVNEVGWGEGFQRGEGIP